MAGIKALEECFGLSRTMKDLNLSGNQIGDEGVEIVINALSNKKKLSLHTLGFSNNGITSRGCKLICEFIKKCPYMEELLLSNNEIDNEGAQHLIAALKNKKQFKNIEIDNNKISGDTLADLFKILPLKNLNLLKN